MMTPPPPQPRSGPARAWLPPMAGGLTRPAWFAPALLAALVVAAGPAQAQTRLLVGNTTAGTARSWEVTSGADFSQAFTTGANSAGYTVANVEIAFNGTPTAADLTALTVTIRTVAEGNNLNPGPASAVVGTFTDPGSGTAGLNTFTAPGSGIQLEASTTYFIHLDVGTSSLATELSARRNARADSGSATGWSIAGSSRRYVPSIGAWGSVNAALEFKLNGQATPEATAPAKPAGLTATAGDAQVTLGWTDPSNSDITRWQFRQRTGGGGFGSWTEIPNSDADTATHTVTGLTNGTEYGFQIRALAGTLQGAASDTVSATPQAPPARFTVSALQVGNQVTLTWSAGGGSITGFQFRQGTGPSSAIVWGAWTNIGNVRRRNVTGLSFAATYHYQVRAVAGTVFGPASDTVTVTTSPGRPTGLAAAAGDGEVALSWTAPSGALTAHEYRQRAAGGSWGAWTAISDSAAISAHTVTGLTNGTEYEFQVRARSGSADSQAGVQSNTASATPVATPAAPTGLTARPANASVSLSWTLPAGDAITGYQYRQGSGSPLVWGTWTDFSDFSGPYEFGRALTGLTNGTEYSFQVRAVVERTVGGATMRVLGAASDTVTATPQPPPARPTNLVAAAGNARVTLTWDDPDDDAISAYFYRYRPAGGSFTDNAQVSGDAFTVTVTGLTNGTAYEFAVYASRGGVTGRVATVTATPVAPSSPGLVLDPTSLTVAEGGSGAYTVKLATEPTGNVTVTVAGASGEVTVDTDSTAPGDQDTLEFTTTTWSTARTVTVSADEDDDTTNDSATLTHSASGGGYGSATGSVAVTVTDNDAAPPPQPPSSGGGGGGGSGGQRPEVAEALEARSVPSGGALALDLSAAFRSPGGGALSFAASSSEPAVASVSVEGAALTVRGLLPGVAEIRVTATDGAGRSISQRFAVTVSAPEAAWHLPPAADPFLQGFVRVVNHSAAAGEVAVTAVDDAGRQYAPLTLRLGPHAAAHFNSDDLEAGNAAKGLSGGAGPGAGGWRLAFGGGALDAEAIGLLRTADGFVTAMAATAPRGADGALRLLTFNPAGNTNQVSRLRLVNPTDAEARATVTGTDDAGASPGSPVVLTLPAGSACEVDAAALESGRGLACGAPQAGLGDGAGKWRLSIASEAPLVAMGLLSSPGGHLTNLSAALPAGAGGVRRVPLFPSASDPYGRQGFVRVANRSGRAGTVTVRAFDDGGRVRERLSLRLEARQARQFNSDDLELGAPAKGLSGRTGSGTGAWRLELSSADLDFEAGAYVRHADGFLTAMLAAAPARDGAHRVATFNPASNANQASRLRLVNWGPQAASATVTGADDRGTRPGGTVEASVPAGSAVELTAAELESGDSDAIASGALGDGFGKWRLRVASDADLSVMSLVSSPMGRLADWSGADESRGAPPLPSLPAPPARVRLEDAGGRRVRGEWDAAPGMRYGVELLLGGAPLEGRSLARTARASFRWSGLAPGAYALRARSVDADGKAGPWSPPTDEVVID